MPARKLSTQDRQNILADFQERENRTLEADNQFSKISYAVTLKAVDAKLSASAYRLWLYLFGTFPFGDREYDLPSQSELAIRLGVTREKITLASAEIQKAGLWDFTIKKWKGRNLFGHGSPLGAKPVTPEATPRCEKFLTPGEENLTPGEENLTPGEENLTPKTPHPALDKDSGLLQTNKTNPEKYTHNAAPAGATPAPHPTVCDAFLNKEEEGEQEATSQVAEIEEEQSPGFVEQLVKNFAQKKSLNQGTNSAAAEKRRKHRSTTSEWDCPGSPEEKLEFLTWKAESLVKAGKCAQVEARGFALSWAKKNAEEATLIFEDWQKERNHPPASVPSFGSVPVVSTAPNFETQTKSWHVNLIAVYRQEGEEAFLARETWHKDWLQHVRTYRRKLLEG